MNILERLSLLGPQYNKIDLLDEKSSVSEEDGFETLKIRPKTRPWYYPSWPGPIALLSTATAVLAVALIVVTAMYFNLLREISPPEKVSCGNSIEEAVAAGCSFDALSKAWLPTPCPVYGTEEFLQTPATFNMTGWTYWTDGDGKNEVTLDELALLSQNQPGEKWSWWGTDREHLTHCAWLIIRLAHAYKTGSRVDALTANFPHTKHCTLMMLERAMRIPDLDVPLSRGDVVFGSC